LAVSFSSVHAPVVTPPALLHSIQQGTKSDRRKSMQNQFDSRLDQAWWILRLGLGLAAFLAGLDKFFNILAHWTTYISPLALKVLPFSTQTFMHIVGVIEMAVGLAILAKWTRLGAYIAAIWLVLIAVNLVTTGAYFDVAVRDVEMALAAFVLARLTEVRVQARGRAPVSVLQAA
jgi:uncharacterized membrane protein YphA (DoxX/SURF4 family)